MGHHTCSSDIFNLTLIASHILQQSPTASKLVAKYPRMEFVYNGFADEGCKRSRPGSAGIIDFLVLQKLGHGVGTERTINILDVSVPSNSISFEARDAKRGDLMIITSG